jgi:hypothetical protein
MSLQDTSPQKWLPTIASLIVLPPWVWLAVRTKNCLRVITVRSIPFPKRTIWLIKILALIIGAGGVFGATTELGMSWLLATLLSGIVIFFALRDSVQDISPPKPVQDASAYQASWKQYRHLRSAYMRSWIWFGVALLTLILITTLANRAPKAIQLGLFAFCVVAVLASIAMMSLKQLKWVRWPCPRCGCSFRGFWIRPLLPKACVYCGLPREENAILNSQANSR